MGNTVNSNKLPEKYSEFVSFVEKEYECSGMCSPSLFYLTQSVELGPPDKGCLAPFMDDVTSLIGNLGNALLASGLIFVLMIFFIFPLCCFQDDRKGRYKEGGNGIEMGERDSANIDEAYENVP